MIQDKIFINDYSTSTIQNSKYQQEITYQRLKKVAQAQLFEQQDLIKNPQRVFQAIEMLTYIDISLAQKIYINNILFAGSLQLMGDQKKVENAMDSINNLDIIGCYSQSEIGSGNNYNQIQTICKYKEETETFILHTPKNSATKTWVANGFNDANYCIVYAKLYVQKKFQGIHPFLVKLREPNGKICKNISISEMEQRDGLLGLDFAQIKFNKFELHSHRMVSKVAKIQNDKFVSSWNIKQRNDHYNQILHFARFSLVGQLLAFTKYSFLLAFRYSQQKQVNLMPLNEVEDEEGNQVQGQHQYLIQTNQFKQKINSLLAETLCLNLAFNESKEIFCYIIKKKQKVGLQLSLVNIILKILVSYNARNTGLGLQEVIGNDFLLCKNRIYELLQFSVRSISGEGDNGLLIQKLAREVFIGIQMRKFDIPSLGTNLKNLQKIDHFNVSETLLDLIKLREIILVQKLKNATKDQMRSTSGTLYQIWKKNLSDLVQQVAFTYSYRIVAELSYLSITKADEEIKPHLKVFLKLFMSNYILKHIDWYQLSEKINKNAVFNLFQDQKLYIEQISEISIQTVESFRIPESLILAPQQEYNIENSSFTKSQENQKNENQQSSLLISEIQPKL